MEERKKILVVFEADGAHRAALEKCAPEADFFYEKEPDAGLIGEADAVLGNLPPERLAEARSLKWLQLCSAGANGYAEAMPSGAALTNASGAYGPSISEYMICAVMNLFLKFPQYRDNQRARVWRDEGAPKFIEGSTALAVGLGNIGGEFAKRYRALGGRVIGVKRTPAPKPDYLDGLYTMDRLDGLLPEADVVALSLPGTPETKGLFGAERLARMKEGAVLVNVGRGTAVDTDALAAALASGHLFGAALDVTDPEPLPEGHPLWGIPSALITPHISGRWYVAENFERIFTICTENLVRFSEGHPLLHRVDLKLGY